MNKVKKIRPIALAIIKKGSQILGSFGFDKVKNEHFFRPLGGGIEFSEKASSAVEREFMEELGLVIKASNFVGVLENIFTFEGECGHEIVLLFDCAFENSSDYEKNEYINVESKTHPPAVWVNISDIKSGKVKAYPEGIADYI